MAEKHTVDENIEVLMASNTGESVTVEYKELIEKIDELFKRNMHKAYSKYNVALMKDAQIGWGLIFTGTRDETKEETEKREAIDGAKRKQIEDAELKMYLKLHKKYGKKE